MLPHMALRSLSLIDLPSFCCRAGMAGNSSIVLVVIFLPHTKDFQLVAANCLFQGTLDPDGYPEP